MVVTEENKMGTMPVKKLLIHMSWPMMLSMFIQALYNMVDSMFVAQLNKDAFVALSFVYPVQLFLVAICVGLGVGVNALLSRRMGQGDAEGANAVAVNGYLLYFVCWVIFAAFGAFFSTPFLSYFTDDAQIAAYGSIYLAIITCGSLGVTMQFAAERVLQATGNPVGPMIVQGVGCVVNLILDPIMIFGLFGFPKMGVAGAALATILGQWIGMAVGFFLVHRCRDIHLHFRSSPPSLAVMGEIFKIGFPAMVMQSLATFMTLGLNKIVALYDQSAVFVLGAYFKIQSFVFMPVYGLNNGLIPVLGYNYGAGSKERIVALTRFALAIAAAIMAAGTLLLLLFPGALLSIFDADAAALLYGIPALRIISLSFLFAGVSVILSAAFQSLGAPGESLVISLLRQLILILPTAWLLGQAAPDLVWWAFLFAEGVCAVVALILYRRLYRNKLEMLAKV